MKCYVLSLWRGPIEVKPRPRDDASRLVPAHLLQEAIDEAAALYRCTEAEILGHVMRRPVPFARQYVMWRLRQHRWGDKPRFSYPEIAYAVGLLDHSAAIHAQQAVEDRLGLSGAAA